MSEKKMASTSLLCVMCNYQNLSKESVIWCFDCEEGLCIDCLDHHRVSKASRQHTTAPIAEYRQLPAEIRKISKFCSEHTERYQTYCKKHDTPCCRKCVVEIHNKCIELAAIDDVTGNVKSSNAFMELEAFVRDIDRNIEVICKDREANLKSLREQKQKIENDIKETRRMINSYLDKIENELVTELEITEEKERKKIGTLLMILEANRDKIKSLQTNIDKIKRYASDLQTFLAMRQIQSDVGKQEELIESFVSSNQIHQIEMTCNIEELLLNILSKVKKFGNIVVEENARTLTLFRQKEKEAQMAVSEKLPCSIDQFDVQLIQKLDTKMTYINGCHIIPDGRMIYSAFWSGKIVVTNSDGSTEFEINPGHQTHDIGNLEEDNIIAVSSRTGQLCIIDLKNKSITRSFDVDKYCCGITARDNTLIYCVQGKGIQQLNLNDKSITDIVKCEISKNSYIATYKDEIYFTNYDAVTCCDFQGNTKWNFKNESLLKSPLGISADNYGNVYVVGYASNSVVVISRDGKQHRQILSTKDGLNGPSVLYFDRESKKLLVANYHYKIFLFSVS